MFDIDNYEKEILAVGYKNQKNETKDKWNQLNLIDIQSLLGNNHCLLLSHMDKSYIRLEETNQCINKFSIGYMMNPNLNMNKVFREQVKVYLKYICYNNPTTYQWNIIETKYNSVSISYVSWDQKTFKENFQSVGLLQRMCVFKNIFTCSLKELLILKFGFIIYPIENTLIRWFFSSSQIQLLAICDKGRQRLVPSIDCMSINFNWFHLSCVWNIMSL